MIANVELLVSSLLDYCFTSSTCYWLLLSCGFYYCEKASSQVAHVNCGNCRTTLMYPYGAPSVKCAVCHYVTNVGVSIDDFFEPLAYHCYSMIYVNITYGCNITDVNRHCLCVCVYLSLDLYLSLDFWTFYRWPIWGFQFQCTDLMGQPIQEWRPLLPQ